jgi:Pyruvate/2-oxoacid:ferredoxin oxidoreductase delta subunit
MVTRDIITIDEEICTGCGQCAAGCPEGAIQVIGGKARLISDLLCDGLGACIGECPEDAITIETRNAEPYDERRVITSIAEQGASVTQAHLKHLYGHKQQNYLDQAIAYLHENGMPVPIYKDMEGGESGCPGSRSIDMRASQRPEADGGQQITRRGSLLQNWPIQLKLANPDADYFDHAKLVIVADCVGFADPNFQADYLKDGQVLVFFCPKLDPYNEEYIEKLAYLFEHKGLRSVTVAHMQVPCCFGLGSVVEEAMKRACKKIPIDEHVIAIQGFEMHSASRFFQH